jgi:catechol 2,3-dioxygenase-like lactoylglutathione lyase family enzyme
MIPRLNGIDHVHVYVHDRDKAAAWYQEVLGFRVSKAFEFWAEDANGPLTIEDASVTIHLALFARSVFEPSTAIAFNTRGTDFLKWKTYLEDKQLLKRCSDHDASWSLYFHDLDNNMHEITSYDYLHIGQALSADS